MEGMKRYIYGAGNNCLKYFSLNRDTDIIGIIDKNREKWGGEIDGVNIIPFEEIANDYDDIIVSVSDYYEIVDNLMNCNVTMDKIKIYNTDSNSIIPLSGIYTEFLKERKFRLESLAHIKMEMLQEVVDEGELHDIHRLVVFSEHEDFDAICEYFKQIDIQDVANGYEEKNLNDRNEDTAFLVCDDQYRETVRRLKYNGFQKILIIPLFDVKPCMRWRK